MLDYFIWGNGDFNVGAIFAFCSINYFWEY